MRCLFLSLSFYALFILTHSFCTIFILTSWLILFVWNHLFCGGRGKETVAPLFWLITETLSCPIFQRLQGTQRLLYSQRDRRILTQPGTDFIQERNRRKLIFGLWVLGWFCSVLFAWHDLRKNMSAYFGSSSALCATYVELSPLSC